MKAHVGRDTDDWGTRGLVARLADGRWFTATDTRALVDQLLAAGVTETQAAGPEEGDWALSDKLRQSLVGAWEQ